MSKPLPFSKPALPTLPGLPGGVSAAGVPILGIPMQVGQCAITAAVRCLCEASNLPMLIRGIDEAVFCKRCGKVYAITNVHFNRALGPHAEVQVSLVGMHASAAPAPDPPSPSPIVGA